MTPHQHNCEMPGCHNKTRHRYCVVCEMAISKFEQPSIVEIDGVGKMVEMKGAPGGP